MYRRLYAPLAQAALTGLRPSAATHGFRAQGLSSTAHTSAATAAASAALHHSHRSFNSSSASPKEDDGASNAGPGPRTRSMDQAAASGHTSDTSGPESAPARSPDAPADPADLAHNHGSDPDKVLRTAAWQADQAMASSYQNHPGPDTGGFFIQQAPHMAGRLAEKVASAADVAAQAASGAASAMGNTVKAASGAAVGVTSGTAGTHTGGRDQSPVSDDSSPGGSASDAVAWDKQWADTNADTAGLGEVDTAGGTADEEMLQRKTEQGGYREAAERLKDIEGVPHDERGDKA